MGVRRPLLGGQDLTDGSQGKEELAMRMGTSQAEGSDLLWYWHPALQHRMLPDTRKHPSHCSWSVRGRVSGGMLHLGITGLSEQEKSQMT